jgi:hypothetical protein
VVSGFVLAGCIYGDAAAQTAMQRASVDLRPGSRVRVTVPSSEPFVGTLLAAPNDSVRVELASGSSITFPATGLTRLELSAGVQRHGWKGAGIGLLTGAVVGGAIGLATYRRPSCIPDPLAQVFCDLVDYTSRQVTVIADAALGGTAGALVGALIGHAGRESWVRVPALGERTRVGLLGGAGIGVRIAM